MNQSAVELLECPGSFVTCGRMKLVRLPDNIHFMQMKFELLSHSAMVNLSFPSFRGCHCIKAKE